MSVLEDLGTYGAAQGLGTLGTDIFLGDFPDRPDALSALFEYTGAAPLQLMSSQLSPGALSFPRIQVRTRALTYAAARAKAVDWQRKLHWLGPTTLSGTRYENIRALQSEPFPLRVDANGRQEFAANYEVFKRPST